MTASNQLNNGSGRTVARPVANLGNTCYMNAVLQALAHAPELCLAMDCEPHHSRCPVAACKRGRSPTSSPDSNGSTRKSQRRSSPVQIDSFCTLCEIEDHIKRVHSGTDDKPVAPAVFVNGFIEHVAPWFKLGVQEDSHEFLRLLIDAMQKSCQTARLNSTPPSLPQNVEDPTNEESLDQEYPFALFRGTVESKVTCGSCGATSSTMDPIEDIGLEVSFPNDFAPTTSSSRSASRGSRNSSPVPPALTDVQQAFKRFARAEALDAGYKCEKCSKVGRATKQSRLASIPPILTLQLKRFRYGSENPTLPARRSGRSSDPNPLAAGKSGSAKIEGHIKFELFFDLHPYLTSELQEKHKNMFCRLFAVIVHAGKNSHSGHYIAYVRNIAVNEWWKMDDGRVTAASVSEVLQAEAYMLFYRVVQHPVSVRLEQLNQKNQDLKRQVKKQEDEKQIAASVPKNEDVAVSNIKPEEPRTKNSRKRSLTINAGIEWARSKTNLPLHLIRKIQDLAAEEVLWAPDFMKILTASGKDGNAPKCVSGESHSTLCNFAPLRAFLWFPFLFLDPQKKTLSVAQRNSDQN